MNITNALPRQVLKLANRYSEEELEQKPKAEVAKFNNLARRAVKQSVAVGIVLLALNEKTPHGAFEHRLGTIGIAKSAAYRFMDLGRNCELVLAALERAPDLAQDACMKIIAAHKVLRLPEDMPWEEQAEKAMEATKKKKVKRGQEHNAERAVAALKKAIVDIQDLVGDDPQAPEAHGAVRFLETQARWIKKLHEEALLKETEQREEDDQS